MVQAMRASATLANGDTTGYGLGLFTEVYRGARLVGHSGADAGYRTYLGRFVDHGLAVVVLCNAAPANPVALARSVADVYLGDKLAPAEPPVKATVTLTAEQLARFAGVYLNELTGAPTLVTLRRDTLILGRTAGPALVPIGERRFRLAGQPVEVEFTPAGDMVQTVRSWPTRRPITLKRQEPARPTRAQLEGYAGSYYSEELGATYTVTATDSTLVLKTRWATADRVVRPAYGDTFVGDMVVTFTRNRARTVDGMLMSGGRVRRVRFERLPQKAGDRSVAAQGSSP
jgi:hypothetical protein